MKVISSVICCAEYKILKTESRTMANSLRTLKMPLFLEFLRDSFKIYYKYNDDVSGEELLEYTELSRIKERHVWIDEFKK